ncbi:MAG: DMT family transporter [Chloroflexi bacterium]|nr:DMT family transporter [Chloroflexota bacterium]
MTANSSQQRPWSTTDLLMLAVVMIWGINFSVLKLALRDFSPLAFNALRFSAASLIILAIMRLRGESFSLARRDLLPVFGLGLLGHTFYQVIFINGLARTTSSNSSLLMATSPIWVAVFGHLLGIERNNRLVWAGILLSFSGTLLLILGGRQGPSLIGSKLLGDVLILVAAMAWAVYTTGSKPLLARYSPLKLTALGMLAGTVPLDLISLPALLSQDWTAISAGAWGGLLYSSVFAVAVGYVFWYTSVQRIGNARTAIYSNLTPVVAVIVAWLVVGDRLTPLQLLGALVVLGGILLTRRGRMR